MTFIDGYMLCKRESASFLSLLLFVPFSFSPIKISVTDVFALSWHSGTVFSCVSITRYITNINSPEDVLLLVH